MLTIAFKLAFEDSPELCIFTTLSLSSYLFDVWVGRSLNILEALLGLQYSAKLKPFIYKNFNSSSLICGCVSSINKYNTDCSKKKSKNKGQIMLKDKIHSK